MTKNYMELFKDSDHVQVYNAGRDENGDRKKKKTTSKDVPGTGMAKKTAKAIEKRQRRLDSI